MRRVRVKIQPLLDAFEATELDHPIHDAILVGITDDEGPEFFEEIKNNDGYFQIFAGCANHGVDDDLAREVFSILQRAVRVCPFATSDHDKFEALFARFREPLFGDR